MNTSARFLCLLPAILIFGAASSALSETLRERQEREIKLGRQLSHHLGSAGKHNDASEFKEALAALDSYEKLRAEFEAQGLEFGGNTMRYTARARALQGLGRHEEALLIGDGIVERSPTWEDAYVERAKIRHRAGKFDGAIADFDKAFEIVVSKRNHNHWRSEAGRVVSQRAESYAAAGQKKRAENERLAAAALDRFWEIERALESEDPEARANGLEKLSALIKIVPTLAENYTLRAIAYAADGKHKLAETDYRKAIEIAPKDANLIAKFAAYLAGQEKFDEALAQSETAIAAVAEDKARRKNQHHNRGVIHFAAGNFKEAIADFDIGMTSGAEDERLLRARAHLAFRNFKDALTDADIYIAALGSINRDREFDIELADALLVRAEILEKSGDAEASALVTKDAQRIRKRGVGAAAYQRGVELFNSGDHAGGLAEISKAVESDPENTRYLADRASAYAVVQDFEAALKDAKLLEKLVPDTADTFNRVGFVYAAQEKFEEALPHFLKALERQPNDIRILRNVAGSYGQIGREKEEATYRKKVLDIVVANVGKERAANQFFRWGEEYSGKGEDAFAVKEYTDALALAPSSIEYRLERARSLLSPDTWKDAAVDATKVLEIDPENAEAHFLRGTAIMDSGELEKALPDLDRTIKLDPEHYSAIFNRALLHRELGSFEKAVADFKRHKELVPDDLRPLENIVTIYRDNGEDDACLLAIDALLEESPNHLGALFLASRIHEAAERYPEAEDVLNRYIEIEPGKGMIFNNRGFYRLQQGKTEAALADFDAALKLSPDDLMAMGNRISALEKLERPEELAAAKKRLQALEEAAAAEKENPGDE